MTVNVTDAVCVAEPAVPVTVMVYVPAGVVSPTASVSVDVPPAVVLVGANAAVA